MKTFKPTFDRVLVRKLPATGITSGGIYLPGKTRGDIGTVEAIGPTAECNISDGAGKVVDTWLKVGSKVLLNTLEETPCDMQQPDLVLIKAEHIMAVVDDAVEN